MPKKKTKKETQKKQKKVKEVSGYYWDGIKSYVLKKSKNILGI